MPVIVGAANAAARPVEASADKLTTRQLCVLVAVLVAGLALLLAGVKRSPAGGVKVPARSVEDVPAFTPPPATPYVGPNQHVGMSVFTPHRYPAACGGEVTSLIYFGHRPLLIPHEKDQNWLMRPPSEVTL
jgi:hypothetical protein